MEYNYTSNFNGTQQMTNGSIDMGTFLEFFMPMFLFIFLIGIAFYVFASLALGRMFNKAGIKSWIAWVPFYNAWKLLEMGSFNGALLLLVLIPFVGPLIYGVISIIAAYRIGLSFGKGGEFSLLYVFLSPIWLGILGFGKAEWSGSKPIQANTAPGNNPVQTTQQPIQTEQPVQQPQPLESTSNQNPPYPPQQ